MKTQRTFLPGSEWLYYEIGCGESYSNIFLIDTIAPLMNRLMAEKIVFHWFFVRLFDNHPILNIRLKINTKRISEVISLFHVKLQPVDNQDLIHEIKIRTYNRELERYGEESIQNCEYLFYLESQFIIMHIIPIGQKDIQIIRAIKTVMLYLNVFEENQDTTKKFINASYNSFKGELKIGKNEVSQLNMKFRAILPEIESNKREISDKETMHLKSILVQLLKIKNAKMGGGYTLLSSIIHMLINRWFRSNQREMEMVIYHHLSQLINIKNK